jgi:hypothetical protein
MIFISHSSKDHKIAMTICRGLENRGARCWISSRDIVPGGNYQESIDQAIRMARAMVLVFTGNANDSAEIKKELALASAYGIAVIPVRAEDVVPTGAFKYELITRQWIDLFDDWEQALERLVLQIGHITGPGSAAAAAPTAAGRPATMPGPRRARPSSRRWLVGGGIALLCVLGVLAAYFGIFANRNQGAPVPALRSAAAALSDAEINTMLTKFDFYDATRNPGGKGIAHGYAPKAIGEVALVLDRATGLLWQRAGSAEAMPLADADDYIKSLNAHAYAGFADWRLPTLEEAMTLLQPADSGGSHIAPQFDPGVNFIWTADHGKDAGSGFVLYFFDGALAREAANFSAWVRAVRSAPQS